MNTWVQIASAIVLALMYMGLIATPATLLTFAGTKTCSAGDTTCDTNKKNVLIAGMVLAVLQILFNAFFVSNSATNTLLTAFTVMAFVLITWGGTTTCSDTTCTAWKDPSWKIGAGLLAVLFLGQTGSMYNWLKTDPYSGAQRRFSDASRRFSG